MKSGKVDESYTIVPPLTLSKLIKEIVKEGNLKNFLVYYDNCDESEQRSFEEAIIEYLNTYSKVLLEISSIILKELYDILDVRRHATSVEDERLKEYTLVNLCFVISKDEIQRILKILQENFRSKHGVNKIMFGKFVEVAKETERILRNFLKENQYQVNLEKEDSQ